MGKSDDTSVRVGPLCIKFDESQKLSTLEELVRLAETERWLSLQSQTDAKVVADRKWVESVEEQKERLAGELAALLPEFRVQRSLLPLEESDADIAWANMPGSVFRAVSQIQIQGRVTAAEITLHLEALVQAARDYRALANRLMVLLARDYGIDVAEFAFGYPRDKHDRRGMVHDAATDTNWDYLFHGVDCRFTSQKTHISIEARMGWGEQCGNDVGLLHPWFFLNFVDGCYQAEQKYAVPFNLFRGWDDNVAAAFQVLEQRGVLHAMTPTRQGVWQVVGAVSHHTGERSI